MMSLPLLGTIIMAYPWGYISDTRGRRFSLLVAMWGSFTASCLAAFSTHWVTMAVLKFISASFSSSAQSMSFTLIGESCGGRAKAVYYFILTSVLHLALPLMMTLHYFTLTFDFSINLGLLAFVPWRLLALALALPLGISATCLLFLFESPKFLVNMEKEKQGLDILKQIWRKNGNVGKYPVEKLVLNEEGNLSTKEVPLLKSLWVQTVPLFKLPLLIRTMQLYFLCSVIYSTTGALVIWFPYLTDAFITGTKSGGNNVDGLCNMISQSQAVNATKSEVSCNPQSDLTVVWASLAQGVTLAIINLSVSLIASRRKLIMITILLISSLSSLGSGGLSSNVATLTLYFVIFLAVVGIGILFSYFVDQYPTSYRGMAACLAVMVCRISNLVGLNLVGTYIASNCSNTFYVIGINFFCGVIASCFLPSDKPKKT